MQHPREQAPDSGTAARAVRVSGVVFGTSIVLLAVAELLLEQGDLTVRLGLLCIGIGAALWGRSKAAGLRDTAATPAKWVVLPVHLAMIVVFILWLLLAFMDGSLAVRSRALFLGVLGALVVYAMMRPVRPPADDTSSRT